MPGDVLCLMQGRYDPRGSKASVRPEHQVDNYLDAVISTAAEFLPLQVRRRSLRLCAVAVQLRPKRVKSSS